jgi:hypothetical protein
MSTQETGEHACRPEIARFPRLGETVFAFRQADPRTNIHFFLPPKFTYLSPGGHPNRTSIRKVAETIQGNLVHR